MFLTKTKKNTALEATARKLALSMFTLKTDRKHLVKKESKLLSSKISITDVNTVIDDVKDMYFVPNALFQEETEDDFMPISNGTRILHDHNIYDRKTALKRINRDLKHRSVTATAMFNEPLTFASTDKDKYKIKWDAIKPNDKNEYLGDERDYLAQAKIIKYVYIDDLDNMHEIDNINNVVALLTDCIMLTDRTLHHLASKRGQALFDIARLENRIDNGVYDNEHKKLAKKLVNKLMNLNSKSPLYDEVKSEKEDWKVGLTTNLLADVKADYQNMLADRETYDKVDLEEAKAHITELEYIKERSYKYSYLEDQSDNKYYPLAEFVTNFVDQAF